MTKKISVILIIITMIATIFCVSVQATNTKATINCDATSIKTGEEISIYIMLDGTSEGIIGMQGNISYDKSKIEYVSCKSAAKGWDDPTFNVDSGIFLQEITELDDQAAFIKTSTKMIEFKFKAKSDAKVDDLKLDLTQALATDSKYTTVSVNGDESSDGSIGTNSATNVENKDSVMKPVIIVLVVLIVIAIIAIILTRKKK